MEPWNDYSEQNYSTINSNTAEQEHDDVGSVDTAKEKSERRGNTASAAKIASRALSIAYADDSTRAILAAVYGVTNDPVALTVASLGAKSAWTAVDKLTQLAHQTELEAAVTLMRSGLSPQKNLWRLAIALGADLPAKVPSNDLDRISALVIATKSLGDLNAAVAVARSLVGGAR